MKSRFLLIAILFGALGCGEDEVAQPTAGPSQPAVVRTPQAASAAPAQEPQAKLPTIELEEADFVESDRSRDPFRSFASAFVEEARGSVRSQREVVLEQYSLDELKLVGIVGNAEPARAMFVDPTGVGYVVVRGQYVGRASVVQPAGGVGASYEVNWRVDRIRDGDVVFVREDPSNPDAPSATRVVPLRTDDEVVDSGESPEGDVSSELAELKNRLESLERGNPGRVNPSGTARTGAP
jgi:type IV pilus assembly protein PilP